MSARSVAASVVLFIFLVVLSDVDLRTGYLPNWLTLPLIALGVVQAWSVQFPVLLSVLGAVIGYLLIFVLSEYWHRVRGRQGIGLGDAKLLAASGSWLGVYLLPQVLLVASAAGLLTVGGQAVLSSKSVDLKESIPFGPFLALATWSVWCFTRT